MTKSPFIKLLIAGELNQDFIIDLSGKPANDISGGSLLYAAAGARMWNEDIGLISRTGNNYPQEWISSIEKHGLDTSGILQLSQSYDSRRFYYWVNLEKCVTDNPVAGYAKFGLIFPKELLDYFPQSANTTEKMWKNIAPRLNPAFPHEYLDINGAHLCPINLMTHIKLSALLQQGVINTITVSPSDDYMNPPFMAQLSSVIKDISAFFPTETQIRSLFSGRSKDLWEMAEALAAMGCPLIVIQRGEKGYWLFDAHRKQKIVLPMYPAHWVDPTGMNDVFAGAFFSEYKNSYDPTQALIAGNASASLAVEGTGPFFCSNSLPGLGLARRDVLQSMLKIV
jgi:sugar/nucleoside kinase (ribokinase family)